MPKSLLPESHASFDQNYQAILSKLQALHMSLADMSLAGRPEPISDLHKKIMEKSQESVSDQETTIMPKSLLPESHASSDQNFQAILSKLQALHMSLADMSLAGRPEPISDLHKKIMEKSADPSSESEYARDIEMPVKDELKAIKPKDILPKKTSDAVSAYLENCEKTPRTAELFGNPKKQAKAVKLDFPHHNQESVSDVEFPNAITTLKKG